MQGEPTTTRRGFFCPDWREIGLWSAAGLVIVCIHAGAAWSLQNIQPDEPSSDIAAAVMIDMEPLPAPVAAQPVRQELPVEPELVNPEPVQQEAAAPEPLEQVQAEPEPQIQPLEEITPDQPEPDLAEAVSPEPEEAEPLDEQAEKLVELPKVEVPLPVVRPQPTRPDISKKRIVEKSARKPVKATEAAVRDEAPREAKRQPAASPSTSRGEKEDWNSRVRAHIARYAQRARVRGKGKSVGLVVVVSESGDIVSVGLAAASGDQEVDQSVRQAVSRAPATPMPPSGLSSAERRFNVTIRVR